MKLWGGAIQGISILRVCVKFFFTAVFLLFGNPALSDDPDIIVEVPVSVPAYQSMESDDLWRLYERAQIYDASFQAAMHDYAIAKEGLSQARSQLLPSLSLFADRTEVDQDIKASDIDVIGRGQAKYGRTTYGINFSQTVFDWSRFMGFNQAKREDLMADAKLLEEQQKLIIKVVEHYIDVLAAEDNLNFFHKEEAAVKEQEATAAARWQAKIGREADYLEAKARATSVYAQRLAAENAYADAVEAIRALGGFGANSYKELSEDLTLVPPQPNDVSEWSENAIQNNLSLLQQRYVTTIARYEIRKSKSGHYPTVNLYGRYNDQDEDGSLFGGSSEVSSTEYGLRLEMPLYSGGNASSKVREATHRYSRELENLQDQLRQVTRETRSAFNDLNTALLKIESFQLAVEAQMAVVDTKKRGYPRLYTSREVLDSERDLYSAKRDLAKSRYEYLLANLRLKSAAGNLGEEDLQELNALFK